MDDILSILLAFAGIFFTLYVLKMSKPIYALKGINRIPKVVLRISGFCIAVYILMILIFIFT